jgi:hypothetical protein
MQSENRMIVCSLQAFVAPFQGFYRFLSLVPRATLRLPWADMWLPLGSVEHRFPRHRACPGGSTASALVFGVGILSLVLAFATDALAQPPKKPSPTNTKKSTKKEKAPARRDEGQIPAFNATSNLIRRTVAFGPTTVVWLFDRSESAFPVSAAVGKDIGSLYEQLADEGLTGAGANGSPPRLLTAILSFGQRSEFVLETPSADMAEVNAALARLQPDESGHEVPFAAVKMALDKYLPQRIQERREVLFIAVTNETGEDGQLVDELLTILDKASIPIYVIGAPAPFGKLAALSQFSEGPTDFEAKGDIMRVRHGPESRYPEVVEFGFVGQNFFVEVFDSGFGPFEWERLCRGSGGKFLMLNSPAADPRRRAELNQRWPSPDITRFAVPPSRYAPDYVPEARYQQLLAQNRSRAAVHNAAKFKTLDAPFAPRLMFEKQSEAELNKILTQAQQSAAKLGPIVDELFQVLQEGESDRAKLTSPRWQAAYDLAMGRACAAKANIDGYNAMLAQLKLKSEFKDPGSTQWVLAPASTIEAGSALQKLVDRAQMYLNRIVKEHPGTPWAHLATRELETQIGWKWTEQ